MSFVSRHIVVCGLEYSESVHTSSNPTGFRLTRKAISKIQSDYEGKSRWKTRKHICSVLYVSECRCDEYLTGDLLCQLKEHLGSRKYRVDCRKQQWVRTNHDLW